MSTTALTSEFWEDTLIKATKNIICCINRNPSPKCMLVALKFKMFFNVVPVVEGRFCPPSVVAGVSLHTKQVIWIRLYPLLVFLADWIESQALFERIRFLSQFWFSRINIFTLFRPTFTIITYYWFLISIPILKLIASKRSKEVFLMTSLKSLDTWVFKS